MNGNSINIYLCVCIPENKQTVENKCIYEKLEKGLFMQLYFSHLPTGCDMLFPRGTPDCQPGFFFCYGDE